jgi:hypothetical protein
MGCISKVSFVVLINSVASTFFKPSRALRQGCPLSPLLFLIDVEGLSRAILDARILGIITSIRIGTLVCLTHLLFVDDVLLFING